MLDYDRQWLNDLWTYNSIATGFITEERERQTEIEKTKRDLLAQLKGQK